MSFEQKINGKLNRFPFLKKSIKRGYQFFCYFFSKKIKYEGNVVCVSPKDKKDYFFGYYDKSPWDASGRYMLCMQAKKTWKDVSPKEKLNILLLDSNNNYSPKVVAQSNSWNVQMGCMAQWLGPTFDKEIIYNDYLDGQYCSIILNIFTGEKRIISAPVYSVSSDGKFALTLDFSRLYSLRPGYGYYNIPEKTKGIKNPNETSIWKIDLQNNKVESLLKYTDFSSFMPREEMKNKESVHKVNHLMISPNNKRFMVLYRWLLKGKKYTRLITCDVDGKNLYLLNDDDMVSHCYWKNNEEILAFERKKEEGNGYYLMKDKTNEYKRLWKEINYDGHPSYSPDLKFVVTDSYPNRKRIQTIWLLNDSKEKGVVAAKVFAPFKYDNDTRCDLHPRWSRDGRYICFDGCFEKRRRLYIIDTEELIK